MSKIEVSPVNNEKRSESSGGNYNIWRKAMNEVLPYDSPDRPANVKEYGSSLNHQD